MLEGLVNFESAAIRRWFIYKLADLPLFEKLFLI